MAANSPNIKELSRKRAREESQEEYDTKKRRKDEKDEPHKEAISIQTYFSLRSQEPVNESQWGIWADFKTIVTECFPAENIDNSDNSLVYVPQSVLPALERINYKKINLNTLKITLENWASFIKILSQLKHPSKSDEECEKLFMQLNLCIEKEDIDLTLTESAGWNVLHIAAFHGRVALLIRIQQQLLPDKLEQYKRLLCAETNRKKAKPASIKKVWHHKEFALLLSEESPPSLKEKQFTVMLRMRLVHGKEPQCATFYEQLKQFIAEGVDPTVTQNIIGVTILHAAVYIGDIELVKHILQHASLKQCEILLNAKIKKEERSATAIAEYKNYREIISLLKEREELIAIFKGLKMLGETENKQPLYERIEQFIKNNGNPDVTDDNGLNFLHYAAWFGDITLLLLVKEQVKLEQYRALLCAKSKNKGLTPYDILERKKKASENEKMLELLNPKSEQNILQPSQSSSGQFTFFNPTLLTEGQDLSQVNPSPTM
ncbi:MAG: hypothetical protein K0R48_757 [Gammaproteobacteria bacterium]|nr:hypothetical protein [Gammaproteobacteria bacterium]